MQKERKYSMDLLKVFSIFMVIILHYNNGVMGGLLANVQKGTFNYSFAYFTEILAIVACNLFVLISGYFLCKNNKIKIRKILDIILLLLFYGVLIYIISIITGLASFSKENIKIMLLTINNRWFINTYILLYIFHPFINKIIDNINKKQFTGLILICIFFFSIWSSILEPSGILNLHAFVKDGGYGITSFIMLYLIGAFIRKYYDDIKLNKILLLVLYILFSILGTLIFDKYYEAINYNFIINVINSIILFLFFKQVRTRKNRTISKIADCSLAIYIIHENSFICKYIYNEIFKTKLFYNSYWMVLHQFLTCISILIICLVIELIRKYLFKITINKVIDKIKIMNMEIKI